MSVRHARNMRQKNVRADTERVYTPQTARCATLATGCQDRELLLIESPLREFSRTVSLCLAFLHHFLKSDRHRRSARARSHSHRLVDSATVLQTYALAPWLDCADRVSLSLPDDQH